MLAMTDERLKILTFFLVELQTSIRGQNGVEFDQESTGHVGFLLALLLANQWEAENANFLVIWPTDKCEMCHMSGTMPSGFLVKFYPILTPHTCLYVNKEES